MLYEKPYIEELLCRFVRPKRPDLEVPLLDTFDALKSGKPLSDATLAALVEAASDRHTTVYQVATEFLGEVAESDENALKMIQDMAVSPHAHVRHNALLSLTEKTPSQVCLGIIRGGLKDKSSRVRRKAADWAIRLPLKSAAPDIANALLTESHSETAQVMRAALRVLQVEES